MNNLHRFLSIPDPGSQNSNKRGEKNLVVLPFSVAKNIGNENWKLFFFELEKKTIWANLQRIIELFTLKIVIKLSKI